MKKIGLEDALDKFPCEILELGAPIGKGLTLRIPRQTEASCLGAAILGTVAAGIYEDIHTAAQTMVEYLHTIRPDMQNHRKYQFYLKKYQEAYLLMKDWMHEVSAYTP